MIFVSAFENKYQTAQCSTNPAQDLAGIFSDFSIRRIETVLQEIEKICEQSQLIEIFLPARMFSGTESTADP
jgi:hypothetical protein